MLKAISNALNFSFDIINAPDQGWGSMLPNGSWSGGNAWELLSGRADMQIGCINMVQDGNMVN
jgi:hypothetical protein